MSQIQPQTKHKGIFLKLSWIMKGMALIFVSQFLLQKIGQLLPVYYLRESLDLRNILAISLSVPQFWTSFLPMIAYICALWAAASLIGKLKFAADELIHQKSDDTRQFLII